MTALGIATLRDLIEALPSGERRLILLRYADRLADDEIAQILDVDQAQVAARLGALEDVLFEQMQAGFERELAGDHAIAA